MPTGSATAGSSSAIRAGGAFVEFFGKDNISKMLGRLTTKVAIFGRFVGKVGTGSMLAGAAMLAPLVRLFSGMMENAKLGVFGDKAQQDAEAFGMAWQDALADMQSALIPVLAIITPWVQQLRDWIQNNKELVKVILIAGVSLLAFGVAAKVAGLALGGIVAVVTILIGLVGALLSPIGLVVAAIGGIAYAFATQTDAGKAFVKDMKEGFASTEQNAKDAWDGIVGAVSKGDLKLAAQIVFKGIEVEWQKLCLKLSEYWGNFKNSFVNTLEEIRTAIAKGLTQSPDLWDFMAHIEDAVGWAEKQLGMEVGPNLSRVAAEELRRDPNGVRANLDAMNAEGKKARDGALAAKLKASADEIAKLQMEFDSLVKTGKAPGQPHVDDRWRKLALGADATKGAFQSPNFRLALGYADTIPQKQLDVQRQIARQQEKTNEILQGLKLPFFS